ncbi:pantetheine-phosphate adenylyltransferase [Sphingobacterium psychroaquaticum]|uniref:Phosphopantetheine adenylyltransferase n=1 Tax=Sphingobacterium psychroaquaticum TaxID=561061 RepID=A0A1X7I7P2_9SPHI|nr:pantetheine-phosphate adenylyltransferase [Sphingobacterium psychroaquaticum]QBQ41855.1 pantetheine-phosphate adenylyltransferase [Sphingobacterium psychroaquaticum]SMG10362.1 Phosphopantetheine adenylyltransferase [Sphingobacterium psychroaquaticum]
MKVAVFAGSFDPFTFAHQDLVERGLQLFDKIIIAVGVNPSKRGIMAFDDRVSSIALLFAGNEKIEVQQFQGLTVDFCRRVGASYILRGLRNTNDFEFENAIAQNNLLLAADIETYFLMARSGLGHISSTIVRDILTNGGDTTELVPKEILQFISL